MQTSTAIPGCAAMDGDHRDTDGHTLHPHCPSRTPTAMERAMLQDEAAMKPKSELNPPPRRGMGCRSPPTTTTKYHLNLNVNNVSRHPHAKSSPVFPSKDPGLDSGVSVMPEMARALPLIWANDISPILSNLVLAIHYLSGLTIRTTSCCSATERDGLSPSPSVLRDSAVLCASCSPRIA
ncbi:hypothetical protein B0H65DRAFT_53908 [Neurospora tetraspora]|uniref:Uncharacterized protein n=1 Tax=Neurospora tetraspora TaxID=94610 RepID=A0AAE0JQH9_9PEZI|nr:hypothetical protein B0H65DRAFT_53908 [Neurospora tetraspora]